MAKRQRKVSKKGAEVEAFEQLDDYILPSPKELEDYKQVDESLIPFLKERATLEQTKRLETNDEIMTLNKREQLLVHGLRYLSLFFGFIFVSGVTYMSYLLITAGHTLVGSIFGGVSLVYVVYLFISVASNKVSPPAKK